MARRARWKSSRVADGFGEYTLSSWKYFHDFVTQRILDFPNYSWRGQANASWVLETSLDRSFRLAGVSPSAALADKHLERFKLASRGRRGGQNASSLSENEWWSIGQHYGLATPLLDWTASPFVALYFAFRDQSCGDPEHRAVWAIGGPSISAANTRLRKQGEQPAPGSHSDLARIQHPPLLEFVRPAQDDNARLVAQAGLFSRTPVGITVDDWIRLNLKGQAEGLALIKVQIPNKGREECLKALNRMNINHLSLFPDLLGAAVHCNTALEIKKYL